MKFNNVSHGVAQAVCSTLPQTEMCRQSIQVKDKVVLVNVIKVYISTGTAQTISPGTKWKLGVSLTLQSFYPRD